MIKTSVFMLMLLTSLSLGCANQTQSKTASSDSNSDSGKSENVAKLKAQISALHTVVSSDYGAKVLKLSALDYQSLDGHFSTMLKTAGDAQDNIGSNAPVSKTADQIGFLSTSKCPINTGKCPLQLIQQTLAAQSPNYNQAIGQIDAQAVLAVAGVGEAVANSGATANFAASNHPLLPLSGSEQAYEPTRWNDAGVIQLNTNCYAYSLNLQKDPKTGAHFPMVAGGFALQPGDFARTVLSEAGLNDPTGAEIIKSAKADAAVFGGEFTEIAADAPPVAGSYKIALVIAPGVDYHWYRQNPDGTWSHKPGATEVRAVDASDQTIWDPKAANRDSGFLNYKWFVGYFEVKSLPLGN